MNEKEQHTDNGDAAGERRLSALLAEYDLLFSKSVELAESVRHEVNNSLTGLLGQTQLLLHEDLSDGVRRRIQVIEQLAGRIRDKVILLSDMPRPERVGVEEGHSEKGAPPRH